MAAAFIQRLTSALPDGRKDMQFTVTIPTYASEKAQVSLMNACYIAGLTNVELLDESTAIAYHYAWDNYRALLNMEGS